MPERTERTRRATPDIVPERRLSNSYCVMAAVPVSAEAAPPKPSDHASRSHAAHRRRQIPPPAMTSAETGRAGERAAAEYLCRAGYDILARNWRAGRYELDIVARHAGVLHFVEVKTRRAAGLTTPEQAVTPAKFRALQRAALRYISLHGNAEEELQFDLAAVDVWPNGSMEVRLIERAMECHW